MTRKEQIEEAAFEFDFEIRHCEPMENVYIRKTTPEEAFVYGAMWADRNPLSPWISVDKRLPKVGDVIVFLFKVTSCCGDECLTRVTPMVGKYYDGLFKKKESTFMDVKSVEEVEYWLPLPAEPGKE